ncbi:MAG: DUF5723 family protein [Porphyromonadaceae bacterium]|nr:DUF5723 family protein [Porphyromonadaceae bacterium]
MNASRFSIKYIGLALLSCLVSAGVAAQPLQGSYFLESVSLRHQLNPALMPDRAYFTIPALGNISFNASSNLGYTTFIYPSTGEKLNTFLSPAVSAADFDKKLRDWNSVNVNFDISILSFGFFKWNGFNTFDISVHGSTSTSLPGDLFRFLKSGQQGEVTRYDLKNVSVSATSYAEVALGHSHEVNDQWTVGAKLKGLFGLGEANAHFDRLTLTMAEDQWKVESYGTADLSLAGAELKLKKDREISGLDYSTDRMGLAGGGAGIDLGVTYSPVQNLVLSLALTDVGFITWGKNLRGATPEGEYIYEGFTGIGSDDYINENGESRNTLDDQVDDLKDDLEALFKFRETEAPSKRTTWLAPTLTFGAEYQLLKNHISVGLLSTTHFYSNNTQTSLMGSVQFKALHCLGLSINGTVSNLAHSFGAVLSLGPLFIGADISTMTVSPEYIPLGDLAAAFNFGLSVPLGKNPKLKKAKTANTISE